MCSIGPKDLIFDKNGGSGIFGCGFSVNSIMMQNGISPIMTLNNNQIGGGGQVSDIFCGLAVPAYAYHNGGSKVKNNSYKNYESDDDSDDDNGVINGDLHDKLLDLVRQHDSALTQTERKKKRTRKNDCKPRKANTRKNNKKTILPDEEQ
jgi:hypothetical protein